MKAIFPYLILTIIVQLQPAIAGECDKYSSHPVKNKVIGSGFYDIDADGQQEELRFILVDGTIKKEECGLRFEQAYEGHLGLQLFKGETKLTDYPLDTEVHHPYLFMDFDSKQKILISDYLHDGHAAFPLLTDYNYAKYKMYSISPSGKIGPIGEFNDVDNGRHLSTELIVSSGTLLQVHNGSYYPGLRRREWFLFKWDGKTFSQITIPLTPAEEAEAIQDIATFLSDKGYDPARQFKYPKKIYARIPAYNWLGISVDRNATQSLQNLSLSEISLIRNEIFARHGYSFKADIWRRIFEKVTWYKLNPAFNPDSLTTAEKNNINAIKEEEAKSSHK